MSSFLRNIQRKWMRLDPNHEPASQRFIQTAKGYITYHFTKGARVVSFKRYAAGRAMASVLDRVLPRRPRKGPRTGLSLMAWQKRERLQRTWPNTVTRQQKRYAARKGLPEPTA